MNPIPVILSAVALAYSSFALGVNVGSRLTPPAEREITCDVTDLEPERWVPVEEGNAPTWVVTCEHYAKPGRIVVLD